MDYYLEYLIEKYLIFDKRVELDESNSIVDIDKIKDKINDKIKCNKKMNDASYISMTGDILEKYNCYDILDFSFKNKKNVSDSEEIYMLYKNYKMSKTAVSKSKVENVNENVNENVKANKKKTDYVIKMDENVDTSGVKYICSVDYELELGELPLKIESDIKKWKREYKFTMLYRKKTYIYSVYDWEGSDRWHVGCDVMDKRCTEVFLGYLEEKNGCCC
jgi:hypothetical protein